MSAPADGAPAPVTGAGDDASEGGSLVRQDSVMSPKIAPGHTGVFPSFTDASVAVGEGDIFTVAPAKNSYMAMIRALLKQDGSSSEFLKKDLVDQLCRDVTEVFKAETSLLELNLTDAKDTLVVVGDVHGQFADLVTHILKPHDRETMAKDRKFLFLGDYVDRGPQGVEVIMLLFGLKVEYPNNIFILRGNHEESQTSRIYGFLFEVRTKFSDLSVWARFNEVFCHLPLAALVSGMDTARRFVALHGGLSPELHDIQVVKTIDRADYGGMLDNVSAMIVDGILWSDPTEAGTRFRGNERGCGFTFGQVATTEFCTENRLEFICRAHQMTMDGYSWTHENKCLTLFSAPNYCGLSNNQGAIMVVTGAWDIQFVQFTAVTSAAAAAAPTPGFMSYF